MLYNPYFSVVNHFQDFLSSERGIGSNGVSGTFIVGYLEDDEIKKIKFVDEYLKGEANVDEHYVMPIITIEAGRFSQEGLELGSDDSWNKHPFLVSIYAEDEIELMRIAQFIVSGANAVVTLKDYDTDHTNPVNIGLLNSDKRNITAFPVRNIKTDQSIPIPKALKHRYEVSFVFETK